jgi:hypothetical protein
MTELDTHLRSAYDKLNKPAKYGTAGFRDLAANMPYVLIPTQSDLIQSRSFCHSLKQNTALQEPRRCHVRQSQ